MHPQSKAIIDVANVGANSNINIVGNTELKAFIEDFNG